jgi:hypothetical protein
MKYKGDPDRSPGSHRPLGGYIESLDHGRRPGPGKPSSVDQKPFHLTQVTEFDHLGDAGNRYLECDFADRPVDGMTLSEEEIVSDGHGDVSEDAPQQTARWLAERRPT